jgi:hypothetical protein
LRPNDSHLTGTNDSHTGTDDDQNLFFRENVRSGGEDGCPDNGLRGQKSMGVATTTTFTARRSTTDVIGRPV